jgi:hypothetical protein
VVLTHPNLIASVSRAVEWFGPSYRFRFTVNRMGLQAFVAAGGANHGKTFGEALNLLDSLRFTGPT